jgi:predicted  nucleic acid-binding Zn-ribbon protein
MPLVRGHWKTSPKGKSFKVGKHHRSPSKRDKKRVAHTTYADLREQILDLAAHVAVLDRQATAISSDLTAAYPKLGRVSTPIAKYTFEKQIARLEKEQEKLFKEMRKARKEIKLLQRYQLTARRTY